MVTDHFLWKSVMAPDMFQEQPGDPGGIQGGDCGYGMNPFRQAIHHHKGSIVPLGVWEFSDHVYGDHRSEEHTSELQSHSDLVCRLLLEKKKKKKITHTT